MTGGWLMRVRPYLISRYSLWFVFVLEHFWLGYQNLFSPSNPMGDVRVNYLYWVAEGVTAHYWVGINAPWVYPIVAIVPMLVAYALGAVFYPSVWLSMVMVLDGVALATLTGWGRRRRNLAAGWWWVLFTLVLGPIATGRIDSVSVAVAMIGVLLVARHPTAASVLVTVATWIKVWPVALLAAFVIAVRTRSAIIGSVVGTSLGILAIALAFGSGTHVFSFITEQTGRGLEAEAPVATFWLWRAFAGAADTYVYYDQGILAFQVHGGPGVALASALMTPLMVIAVAIVAVLGIRAQRRDVPVTVLLPLLALGFVAALITFNKVGSPQYVSWLAVPIVLALATEGEARALFRRPALIVFMTAGLTQLIYPYFFDEVILARPAMLIVLTARNILLIALFCWSVAELWSAKGPFVIGRPVHAEEWTETTWPFASGDLGSREPDEPLEPTTARTP